MGAPLETAFIFSYNPPRRGFQIDLQKPLEVETLFSLPCVQGEQPAETDGARRIEAGEELRLRASCGS